MSAGSVARSVQNKLQPAPLLIKEQPVFSPEMARPDALNDPNSPASIANRLTKMEIDTISYSRYAPPVPPPIKESFTDMTATLYNTYNNTKIIQLASISFIFGGAAIFFALAASK